MQRLFPAQTFVCPQLKYAPSFFGLDKTALAKKLYAEVSVDVGGHNSPLWSVWKLAVVSKSSDMEESIEKKMAEWRTVYSLLRYQPILKETFAHLSIQPFTGLTLGSVPTLSTSMLLDQLHRSTVKMHSIELTVLNASPSASRILAANV